MCVCGRSVALTISKINKQSSFYAMALYGDMETKTSNNIYNRFDLSFSKFSSLEQHIIDMNVDVSTQRTREEQSER